jgi:O-antigen/teichoic acid export membrane protein
MRKGVLDFFFVAVPKIVGGAGAAGVNVILLRYFEPEQFGMFYLCVTGILLADGILGSAFDMGVLRLAPAYRVTDEKRSLAIEKAAAILKILVALAVGLLLVFFAQPLSKSLFQQEGTAYLLYLSGCAALGMLLFRSVLVHLQVEGKFALYGSLDLLHNVLKFGGIALLLAFSHPSLGAVLTFFALGPACVFVLYVGACGKKFLGQGSASFQAASELLDFVKWPLLIFSLAALLSRVDMFLLTLLSDMREVGIFSGGQAFAVIPDLVGSYLAVVLSPRIIPYCREGRFFAFFWRFQLASLIGCVVIYLAVMLSLETILSPLLPASFAPSVHVLMILLPGALIGLVMFPLVISFLMFIRPKFLFTMDCISAPVIILLYLYAIPRYGAVGAAWVTSVSRLSRGIIAHIVAWKWARRTPEMFRQDVMPAGTHEMKLV